MIGRVLDASVVDAIMTGHPDALGELALARSTSSPLWLSAVALAEVRALRPQLLEELYELVEHPSIVRRPVDPAAAAAIDALHQASRTFDVATAHTALIARDVSASVVSADPGRLHRVDPTIEIVQL